MIPKLVYIAGPYRSQTPWGVEQNIRKAKALAYHVASLGAYPVTPHANTRGYFEGLPHPAEFWLEATLELMRRCDAIALVEGWSDSSGARAEHAEAKRLGLPIFHHHDMYGLGQATFERWLATPRMQETAT